MNDEKIEKIIDFIIKQRVPKMIAWAYDKSLTVKSIVRSAFVVDDSSFGVMLFKKGIFMGGAAYDNGNIIAVKGDERITLNAFRTMRKYKGKGQTVDVLGLMNENDLGRY